MLTVTPSPRRRKSPARQRAAAGFVSPTAAEAGRL